MKIHSILLLFAVLLLCGCSQSSESISLDEHQNTAQQIPSAKGVVETNAREETNPALNTVDSRKAAPGMKDPGSLDEYILYAIKESAELQAAFATYEAALLKAPQVSTLPDPKLNYGYFVNSVETRVGPMDQKVGASQPIPWFGKLGLREQVANAEAMAAHHAFIAKKNNLVSAVTEAYFELAYLESALEITEANFELLQRWEQVLAGKYRARTGSQANLIKVQVELGKLEDKVRELRDLKFPLLSEFNALLNRPPYLQVQVSKSALQSASQGESMWMQLAPQSGLEALLSKNNPELLFLNALIEARRAGIDLAHKDFYPDFSVGADYTFVGDREQAGSEGGDDALVAMLSLKIPLYREKYEAGLKQAEKQKASAEKLHRAKLFRLQSKLSRTVFDLKDSLRRIQLYRDTLVPKAEESMESTYTAFEAGEATFLDLLDTERVFLEFKLLLSRGRTDHAIAGAQLRALLGDYGQLGEENSNGVSK